MTRAAGSPGASDSLGTSDSPGASNTSGTSDSPDASSRVGLSLRRVSTLWWPLALSWAMMGLEQPLVGAAVARLPDAEVQLAAWGSFAFPVALVVEAPVIMLLAASTELSRDRPSYRALSRVAHGMGLGLTLLHLLVVATPLYHWLAESVLGLPPAVREPARLGLLLMLPWTWAIASRRFHQGVLIRHGQSRAVGWGTALRLCTCCSVLGVGLASGRGPGVAVAATALSCGVLAEAIYAALRVRRVVRALPTTQTRPLLRGWAFLRFYVPLALTPLVTLLVMPVGTASVSRMPDPLPSLAVWPLANAVVFVLQALGLALHEVMVALLDEPGARAPLRRFSVGLLLGTTVALLVLSLPPVAHVWFSVVAGLSPALAAFGASWLWLALPIPATRVAQSWYQGLLVHSRRTQPITEAVVVFAAFGVGVLVVGVREAEWDGLPVVLVAYSLGRVMQTGWLAIRSRGL